MLFLTHSDHHMILRNQGLTEMQIQRHEQQRQHLVRRADERRRAAMHEAIAQFTEQQAKRTPK